MNGWIPLKRGEKCKVCDKIGWCMYSDSGDVLCNRVQSDKPLTNGGWLHKSKDAPQSPVRPLMKPEVYKRPPSLDASLWWHTARRCVDLNTLDVWAERLGIPCSYLLFMGATTACEMLCFPMRDGAGKICGIRTRNKDGEKKAITGSKAGVFIPGVHDDNREAIICEGPTDAASAMALGFEPIGRPSCLGCEVQVVETLKRFKNERVTVCADNDGPGINGAKKMIEALRASRITVRVVTPAGHKDLRDWLKAGATAEIVQNQWSQAEWR